ERTLYNLRFKTNQKPLSNNQIMETPPQERSIKSCYFALSVSKLFYLWSDPNAKGVPLTQKNRF
ncbi:hypothetical protein ACQJ9V_07990, partial [Helicobacter pylori]